MKKIQFDSGIQEYRFNGAGVLRFNPGDPNLYARFLEAADRIGQIEKDLAARAQQENASVVALLQAADREMKKLLSWVFGEGNDFDRLLEGVNLLAVASNGERVVSNLFAALEPVLLTGAQAMTRQKTEEAVAAAKRRRAEQ